MNQYNLDSLLAQHFRMIVFGSSGSGKTYYICNKIIPVLLEKYQAFFVISPNYNGGVYPKHLPKTTMTIDSTKFHKGDGLPEKLKQIEFVLQSYKKKGVKDQHGHAIFKYNSCIILDDVLSEKDAKSDELPNMFMRFRHYNCSLIFTSNSCTRIVSQAMIANSTHLIHFRFTAKPRNDAKHMIENYIDCKGTEKEIKKEVEKVYTKYLDEKKYGCLIIDVTNNKIYTN